MSPGGSLANIDIGGFHASDFLGVLRDGNSRIDYGDPDDPAFKLTQQERDSIRKGTGAATRNSYDPQTKKGFFEMLIFPVALAEMKGGQANEILLHELLHVLLWRKLLDEAAKEVENNPNAACKKDCEQWVRAWLNSNNRTKSHKSPWFTVLDNEYKIRKIPIDWTDLYGPDSIQTIIDTVCKGKP